MASFEIEKWTDIIPSAIRIPLTVYKNRRVLQYIYKTILSKTDLGNTNVVVLGRPNVGKSVMVNYLYGKTKDIDYLLPDTSTKVESSTISISDRTHLLRNIPGQTSKQRAKGLKEAFIDHKDLHGIIYVTNWGYTSERSNIINKLLVEERGLNTIEKLREYNLKQELEDFKIICNEIQKSIQLGKRPKWLLTVVNKADLFFTDEELINAQLYYHPSGSSEYGKITQNLINSVGSDRLKCDALPLCAYASDFEWNSERVRTKIGSEDNIKALAKYFYLTLKRLS